MSNAVNPARNSMARLSIKVGDQLTWCARTPRDAIVRYSADLTVLCAIRYCEIPLDN
jgi:hypothetical protein